MHSYSNCSFIFDSYSINLCLGYQLFIICPLIPLYFSKQLHRYSGIFLPNVWTLPSESCLPFCLEQEYRYPCGQGGDVTEAFCGFEMTQIQEAFKGNQRRLHVLSREIENPNTFQGFNTQEIELIRRLTKIELEFSKGLDTAKLVSH